MASYPCLAGQCKTKTSVTRSQLLEQQTVCQARKEIGGCTKPNTLLHLSSCPCGKPPNFSQHVIRSSQIAVTLLLSANEYEQVITRWQLSWMISPRNSLRVLALESATLLGHPVWPASILTMLVLFLRPKFSLVNPNCGCHKRGSPLCSSSEQGGCKRVLEAFFLKIWPHSCV